MCTEHGGGESDETEDSVTQTIVCNWLADTEPEVTVYNLPGGILLEHGTRKAWIQEAPLRVMLNQAVSFLVSCGLAENVPEVSSK